jgi:hypothetical protein
MRKLFAFMALGTILVVVAATAQAQRGGGGFGTPSGYQLLANKSVQEELKLTDEQKTKVKEVTDKIFAEAKEKGFGGGKGGFNKDATKEEREKALAKIREAAKETNDKAMKELTPILKEEQVKRLKQIEHQQMRMAVFTDAETSKALAITDEQKEKIKGIAEEVTKDTGEINTAIRNKEMDFKDGGKKMEAIRKDGMDKALAILTDDQKSKYKALVGEPFEYRAEFGGGFGGGFGGKGKKDKDK